MLKEMGWRYKRTAGQYRAQRSRVDAFKGSREPALRRQRAGYGSQRKGEAWRRSDEKLVQEVHICREDSWESRTSRNERRQDATNCEKRGFDTVDVRQKPTESHTRRKRSDGSTSEIGATHKRGRRKMQTIAPSVDESLSLSVGVFRLHRKGRWWTPGVLEWCNERTRPSRPHRQVPDKWDPRGETGSNFPANFHGGPVLTLVCNGVAQPISFRASAVTFGTRYYFECPGCGRSCGTIYLTTGRGTVRLPLVSGLRYESQRHGADFLYKPLARSTGIAKRLLKRYFHADRASRVRSTTIGISAAGNLVTLSGACLVRQYPLDRHEADARLGRDLPQAATPLSEPQDPLWPHRSPGTSQDLPLGPGAAEAGLDALGKAYPLLLRNRSEDGQHRLLEHPDRP